MSHRTQTTVRHWFDLTPAERFTLQVTRTGGTMRAESVHCSVVDGSLSSGVEVHGVNIRKDTTDGARNSHRFWDGRLPEALIVALRAHGIPVAAAVPVGEQEQ